MRTNEIIVRTLLQRPCYIRNVDDTKSYYVILPFEKDGRKYYKAYENHNGFFTVVGECRMLPKHEMICLQKELRDKHRETEEPIFYDLFNRNTNEFIETVTYKKKSKKEKTELTIENFLDEL